MAQRDQKNIRPIEQEAFYWTLFFGLSLLLLPLFLGALLYPFLVSVLFAYAVRPLSYGLQQWGMGPALSALCLLGLLFLAFIFLGVSLFPLLKEQMLNLSQRLPHYTARAQHMLETHAPWVRVPDFIAQVGHGSLGLLKGAVSKGEALLNALSFMVIFPLVSFLLMKDWGGLMQRGEGLVPERCRPLFRQNMVVLDGLVGRFFRGQSFVALCLGVFYTVAFFCLGLKYALLLGFLSGVFSFFSYVGMVLGGFLALLVGWNQFESGAFLLSLFFIFMLGQGLESLVLSRHFVERRIRVPSFLLLVGLFMGGSLYGFWGAFLATPYVILLYRMGGWGVHLYKKHPYYQRGA